MARDAENPWQIAVVETQGWAKRPIQLATGGRFTHAYLTTSTHSFSMEPGGLIRREFGYWGEHAVYSRFDLTAAQKLSVLRFLDAHALAKYDWVGDGLVGLDDVTPAFLDRAFQHLEAFEDKVSWAWFCSAFVDAAFTEAGITVVDDPGRPYHGVTPNDLARAFESRGWD